MARPRAAEVARVFAGFVLGAVMVVFMPPLAFAIALVLGGLVLWSRLRQQEVQPLTGLTVGFLVAVLVYVLLAVAYAVR